VYEEASGQAINLPKSEIYCSRNVPDPLRQNITAILWGPGCSCNW
jgi:hypothetical protein